MSQTHFEDQLAHWGIDDATAQRVGMVYCPDTSRLPQRLPAGEGIVIPYHGPDGVALGYTSHDGQALPFVRVRRLNGAVRRSFTGAHNPIRYVQPPRSGVRAYFPPVGDWAAYIAGTGPLVITEGEAKAITASLHGAPCIGLGGVYSFADSSGQLLPELRLIPWRGRHVYIVFDSDAASNPHVVCAEARLVELLQVSHGAHCHVVRLPEGAGGAKQGVDDFIHAHGAAAYTALLADAKPLSGLTLEITRFNSRYAWIDVENAVYDSKQKLLVPKASFTSGHEASTIICAQPATSAGGKPKSTSVAQHWLTSRLARRYREILFRPGEGARVQGDHGPALNMWDGWRESPGSVKPWAELTQYIFSELPKNLQDLPTKLIAYKAQNPQVKVPLALVLIGPQGGGKTLWAECVSAAFGPWNAAISPDALASSFHGWIEKSIVATIHEIDVVTMKQCAETLKALISDERRSMNDKWRPVRDVISPTFYIMTSNNRGVGAYSHDDRRMIVVDTPAPGDGGMYERVGAWRRNGGTRALMHWLLHYDLHGWAPPSRAPMTAEKAMASQEALTPIQSLAAMMREADEHVVVQWLDMAIGWADQMELGRPELAAKAVAVRDAVGLYEVRPWYTPEELAMMFPTVVEVLTASRFNSTANPAGAISRELREAGVKNLKNIDDPRGFRWKGTIRNYLVIANPDDWGKPITQEEFERRMNTWPTYAEVKSALKKSR